MFLSIYIVSFCVISVGVVVPGRSRFVSVRCTICNSSSTRSFVVGQGASQTKPAKASTEPVAVQSVDCDLRNVWYVLHAFRLMERHNGPRYIIFHLFHKSGTLCCTSSG